MEMMGTMQHSRMCHSTQFKQFNGYLFIVEVDFTFMEVHIHPFTWYQSKLDLIHPSSE